MVTIKKITFNQNNNKKYINLLFFKKFSGSNLSKGLQEN